MSRTDSGQELLPLPRPGAPPVPRVPEPIRVTLSNGLRVVAVPRAGLPQIAMRLIVPAGAAADPHGFPGTAALAGALLTEGTARRDADALNERLDALGASLGVQVGHDFAEVDLSTLSDTLAPALELFGEVVTAPSFPHRETERTRAETLDSLSARLDEPANVADDHAAEAVFGAEHPYGRLTTGTPDAVAAVGRDELVRFHAARYRPVGSVLVIAGDIDADALPALLEGAFAGWSGSGPAGEYPGDSAGAARAGDLLGIDWPEAAQAEIRFAGRGMPRHSADWVPAAVANFLLGGSTITGRLGANLREDKGWTYGVRSGFAAAVQAGGWVIETAVDAEIGPAAVAEIEKELTRFVQEPVTAEELHRAKQALILSLPRAFETPGRIVGRLATVEAFGLPADYWDRFPARVEAVTADDVLRIARTYFAPDRLVRVVVGRALPADA